jgi:conjugative transfer signal peptidase TraF
METTPMTHTSPRSRWLWLLVVTSLLMPVAATRIQINPTATSAPRGIYLVMKAEHRHGGRVRVCLPESLARFGRGRGYLDRGSCPGGVRPVGKRIVALPGDTVVVSDGELFVNGTRVARVRRLPRDSGGRFIPAVPEGSYEVVPGTAWLVSGFHPRSWDSRYYGAVPLAEGAPVLVPLLLIDRPVRLPGVPRR